MDKKKQQDLLARIAEARKRRAAQGVTSQQLHKIQQHAQRNSVVAHQLRANTKAVRQPQYQRPLQVVKQIPPSPYIMFITGGIGDVFALESFMTDEERRAVQTILYATNKREPLIKLFSSLPSFPNLKEQKSVWEDFSKFWCFFSLEDCISRVTANGRKCPIYLKTATDYSIMPKFQQFRSGQIAYTGSSFLKHKLADVGKFGLPEEYVAICPYSTDKRLSDRDFSNSDWSECISILKMMGLKGVVINKGNDSPVQDPSVVCLHNHTEITEAVEILKGAKGYIGIDTGLSVLAAQLFAAPRLLIKSRNSHLYDNKDCYYPSHKSYDFIVRDIKVSEAIKLGLKETGT